MLYGSSLTIWSVFKDLKFPVTFFHYIQMNLSAEMQLIDLGSF